MKENEEVFDFTPQMIDFLDDLLSKAQIANDKTEGHKNCDLKIGDLSCPVRVDDIQLLLVGCRLLPNIVNYLVNILPQFLYPYVVAYLQDLSTMRDDPITISELYSYLIAK